MFVTWWSCLILGKYYLLFLCLPGVDAKAIVSKEPTRSKSNAFKKPAMLLLLMLLLVVFFYFYPQTLLSLDVNSDQSKKKEGGIYAHGGVTIGCSVGRFVCLLDCLFVRLIELLSFCCKRQYKKNGHFYWILCY